MKATTRILAFAVGLLNLALAVRAQSSGLTAATQSRPFGGKPTPIPGHIEAEDFDEGPEGVAFHHVDPIMQPDGKEGPRALGLAYRKGPVELEKSHGTMFVAFIKTGEWLNYTVEVDADGTYELEAVVSGWRRGDEAGIFRIEFNGVDKTGPIVVANTSRWMDFRTLVIPGIELKKGVQTMRIVIGRAHTALNLDSFRFNRTSPPFPPPPPPKAKK